MTVERTDILIVGAGLAGARCAEALRAEGYDGRILVVGDEPHPPYERPALSKELLAGSRAAAELALREPGFWAATRDRAPAGDAHRQRSTCAPAGRSSAPRRSAWRQLVLATGVRARRIPGLDGMTGIHHLRTLDDAEIAAGRARARRSPRDRRSGLRGARGRLERPRARPRGHRDRAGDRPVRADARSGGRLPPRRACPERRRRPAAGHADWRRRARWRRRGLCGRAGRRHTAGLRRRRSSASERGRTPSSPPACSTSRRTGVVPTDACGRTAADGVFACGDVASVAHPSLGRPVRLEHWSAAAATAQATAGAILGRAPGRSPVPFFWSDQFGWRIQAVGHVDPALRVSAEGDGERFVARYRDTAGRLRAAVVGNRRRPSPRAAARAGRRRPGARELTGIRGRGGSQPGSACPPGVTGTKSNPSGTCR